MTFMNNIIIRKMIAVVTCVCFALLCSSTAFASGTMELSSISNISSHSVLQGDGYVIEQYTYEENGKQLECTLRIMENKIVGVVYEIGDSGKSLYDQFTITRVENALYMNNTQIAVIDDATMDNTVMPMEVYPYTYTHGEVDFTDQITAASWYLSNQMNTGYYQVRMQLETFPENVPPEYTGAVTKIDYLYTLYKSGEMTSNNRAATPVSDVYYGMPY